MILFIKGKTYSNQHGPMKKQILFFRKLSHIYQANPIYSKTIWIIQPGGDEKKTQTNI